MKNELSKPQEPLKAEYNTVDHEFEFEIDVCDTMQLTAKDLKPSNNPKKQSTPSSFDNIYTCRR